MTRLAILLTAALALPVSAQRPPTWSERVSRLETPEMRRRVLAVNVGGMSLLTLGRGVAEGHVETVGDVAGSLGWGAVAGAGFYVAKDLSGRGRPALAIGLAALAGSLAENAATGGGIAGHLRIPLGVADVRIRTPFATTEGGPAVGIEADALVIGATVALPLRGGRPRLRRGVPVFEYDDLGGRPGYTRNGRTVGNVILIEEAAAPRVLSHETIHRIQAMQVTAVTPYGTVGEIVGDAPTAFDGAVRFDARAEWLYVVAAVGTLAVDYLDRWPEVEARALDEPLIRPAP